MLKEIEPIIQLPKKSILKAISIKEKIEQIKKKILSNINLSFSDLIKESKTRTEVIVAFLGVLELVKQKAVVVKQEEVFKEIIIKGCDLKSGVYGQK